MDSPVFLPLEWKWIRVLPESSRPTSKDIHDEQMQSSGSDRFRKWSGRTQRHIKGRSEKYKGLPWRLLEGGAI